MEESWSLARLGEGDRPLKYDAGVLRGARERVERGPSRENGDRGSHQGPREREEGGPTEEPGRRETGGHRGARERGKSIEGPHWTLKCNGCHRVLK
jgi:hypothetical protein